MSSPWPLPPALLQGELPEESEGRPQKGVCSSQMKLEQAGVGEEEESSGRERGVGYRKTMKTLKRPGSSWQSVCLCSWEDALPLRLCN